MNYHEKYRPQENPFLRGAVSGIQSLVDGTRPKDVLFRMYDDGLMEEWLDKNDYEYWMQEKSKWKSN